MNTLVLQAFYSIPTFFVADFFAPAFTPQVRQFQRDILSSVLGYSSFYRLDMPFSKNGEPLDCCCISDTGKCDRMELERD